MKKNLKEIIDYIEDVRGMLLDTINNCDSEKFVKKEDPGRWSVMENVNHLHLSEIQINSIFAKLVDKAEQRGFAPDKSNKSWLNSLDEYSINEVKEKINAPSFAVPVENKNRDELNGLLVASRIELLSIVEKLSQYDMTKLEFPHPMTRGRMNLYQWLVFLGKHEERHIKQIKELIV
ncbi:MAG: DinB family protein [Acidobacteriota bacterium]